MAPTMAPRLAAPALGRAPHARANAPGREASGAVRCAARAPETLLRNASVAEAPVAASLRAPLLRARRRLRASVCMAVPELAVRTRLGSAA